MLQCGHMQTDIKYQDHCSHLGARPSPGFLTLQGKVRTLCADCRQELVERAKENAAQKQYKAGQSSGGGIS